MAASSHYIGLLGLISAYGASITSLGLALATWVSRLGRAVALCVAAYIVFSIGWLILLFVVVVAGDRTNEHFLVPAVMGSPLYGVAFATMAVGGEVHLGPGGVQVVWVGTVFWIVVHGVIATALFAITVATFDRCLGRVSETSGFAHSRREREAGRRARAGLLRHSLAADRFPGLDRRKVVVIELGDQRFLVAIRPTLPGFGCLLESTIVLAGRQVNHLPAQQIFDGQGLDPGMLRPLRRLI